MSNEDINALLAQSTHIPLPPLPRPFPPSSTAMTATTNTTGTPTPPPTPASYDIWSRLFDQTQRQSPQPPSTSAAASLSAQIESLSQQFLSSNSSGLDAQWHEQLFPPLASPIPSTSTSTSSSAGSMQLGAGGGMYDWSLPQLPYLPPITTSSAPTFDAYPPSTSSHFFHPPPVPPPLHSPSISLSLSTTSRPSFFPSRSDDRFPPAHNSPTFASPINTGLTATEVDTLNHSRRSSSTRAAVAGSGGKGKQKSIEGDGEGEKLSRSDFGSGGEEEEGDVDDKRKRNTEASGSFESFLLARVEGGGMVLISNGGQ